MSTPTWATSGTRVVHSTGLTGSISDCKGSRAKVKFDGDPGDILVGQGLVRSVRLSALSPEELVSPKRKTSEEEGVSSKRPKAQTAKANANPPSSVKRSAKKAAATIETSGGKKVPTKSAEAARQVTAKKSRRKVVAAASNDKEKVTAPAPNDDESASSTFFRDLQAALTLTLMSVPTSVAYAAMAGLPGTRGLTTPGVSLIAFSFATGHKWLASGATSIAAVTVKADLASYQAEGSDYVSLVCLYSLMVGVASMLLALCRGGAVAKAIPKPVMSGFKWGAAMVILFSQTPDCLLGDAKAELAALLHQSVDGGGSGLGGLGGFAQHVMSVTPKTWGPIGFQGAHSALKWFALVGSPAAWRLAPAVLALGSIWFLALGGSAMLLPKKAPQGSEVLLVCGVATLFSVATSYSTTHGIASVIGTVPLADPTTIAASSASSSGNDGWLSTLVAMSPVELPWSSLPWQHVSLALFAKALVFACVDFSATVAICSTFETENGLAWDANRELMAQGVANVAAGLTGSQPVGGSLSRSLVTRLANAYSPRAAALNGCCLLCLLPMLWVVADAPKCVLAAVVVSQILGTVSDDKRSLRNLRGVDAFLGWATALVTVLTDPTQGIVAGCVLASAVAATSTLRREVLTKTASE